MPSKLPASAQEWIDSSAEGASILLNFYGAERSDSIVEWDHASWAFFHRSPLVQQHY